MQERIWLDVPYREKDIAKSLGAEWDAKERRWFASLFAAENLIAWMAPRDAKLVVKNKSQSRAEPSKGTKLSVVMATAAAAIASVLPESLWIVAEVASIKKVRGGAVYFEFIERSPDGKELAKAQGVLWGDKAEQLLSRFERESGGVLKEGMSILFAGKPTFSAQRGFGLTIENIDASWSIGESARRLAEARAKLISEGVMNLNKGLPSPSDFFNVVVIAPSGAAGLGDFMADAMDLVNAGLCSFHLYEALFEGSSSKDSLLKALSSAKADLPETNGDALVIVRGGGASTSLQWLNEEDIGREICLFPIPVFTGIGHEKDSTLPDECANRKFDTPSKVIAGIRDAIFDGAIEAAGNMESIESSARRLIDGIDSRLEAMADSALTEARSRTERMEEAANRCMSEAEVSAAALVRLTDESILSTLREAMTAGPMATLERGYAVVSDESGKWLRTAEEGGACEEARLRFADGELEIIIKKDMRDDKKESK